MSNANPTNAPPSALSPTASTIWVLARQVLLILSATSLGAKYIPPEAVSYLTANWSAIGLAGAGVVSLAFGLYKSLRGPTLSSAAAQSGAVVLLDSQAEADKHTSEAVIGPVDALPIPPTSR